jgi:hypothetical protein
MVFTQTACSNLCENLISHTHLMLMRIKEEMRFQYKKKQHTNRQIYTTHIQAANEWGRLWNIISDSMHHSVHQFNAPLCTPIQCTTLYTNSMHHSVHQFNAPLCTPIQCTTLYTNSMHHSVHQFNAPLCTPIQCTTLYTNSRNKSSAVLTF